MYLGNDMIAEPGTDIHLQRLFDQALDLLAVAGSDSRIVRVNPAFERALGWPEDELLDMPFLEIAHPDDLPAVHEVLAKLSAGEQVVSFVARWRRKDGGYTWIEWNVRAQGGYVYGCGRDVTARRAQQDELRAARERYETLARLAPVGIYMTDAQGNGVFANRHLEKISAISEEEGKGQGWMSIIHPEDRAALGAKWGESISRGGAFELAHRVLRPDGGIRHVRSYAEPLRDTDGALAGFVGVIHDVTEQVEAVNELDAARTRYETLARLAPVGIFTARADGTTEYANEQLAETTGVSIERVMRGEWADALHPEDRERVLEHWARAAGEGIEFEDSYRFTHPDGGIRWVSARVRPLPAAAGERPTFVGIVEDITERKRLTDLLEETNAELEEFTYAASHDLREPLRTITGFCELLEEDLNNGQQEAAREDLRVVLDGTRRMQGLVRELLALSRSSKQKLDIQPTLLEDCFRQARQDLTKLIESTGATVIADDMPEVMADAEHLVRVFQNLISNGIKYQPDGAKAQVRVTATESGGMAVVRVEDNGIGIAAEHHDKLFGAFKRLHGREKYDGFGIGLAICKRTVERHKGTIRVESEPGKGSTFIFTLPLASAGAVKEGRP